MKSKFLTRIIKNRYQIISAILIAGFGLTVLFLPEVVHAIKFDPFSQLGSGQSGLPQNDVNTTVFTLIKGFLQFVGVIALVLIIYGGFTWMTGGGSQEKIKKGRDIVFWALIGTLVILSSLGIIEFIDTII
ncbi:MAG: hypothetical protein A2233_01050 [Candidatus Kerfeldbacteria bacterium RIFOXYA2_FULL_38_24]|uniref:Uncharacterized protein n=1 Tax=Candidatus Kerfeldbacteria bacterium RIFOXYB2_FULL_38_14 TaxID=1798547 RepID=A0A1G2BBI4_9BACT|nr:MAG: hypothetical protein A2233_01050 [Candidatus Kerfeldbacteria bacterium RIFOXYA2_FULL_38_24]OGY86524.1 MAG: hypothetical protein A2319_02040 [Candidatus Kerfeldbacteria bacterium RIFOXYB2_FULL_38_14]OGY89271.1 MAG: hypothetical protein A2458_00840 [Candidatus Kerfeldbacteria bacterium RIFOXYC2_FULL_38_9]